MGPGQVFLALLWGKSLGLYCYETEALHVHGKENPRLPGGWEGCTAVSEPQAHQGPSVSCAGGLPV